MSPKIIFKKKFKLLLGMLVTKSGLEAVKVVLFKEHMKLLSNIRKIKRARRKKTYPHEMPIQTSVLSLHVLLFEMFRVYIGHEHMQDIIGLLFKYI